MARSLDAISLRALFARETRELLKMLATIDHPSIRLQNGGEPIRVCDDIKPIISKDPSSGKDRLFYGWRFDIQFPSDSEGELPRAQAVFDDVDPAIGDAIRSLASLTPPLVTVEIVRYGDPDTILVSYQNLKLRNVSGDGISITGTLSYEAILNEPIAALITPSTVPGVFG